MGPFLQSLGYLFDDRVDEPGEAAIRGRVVDFYPPAATCPAGIEHEEGPDRLDPLLRPRHPADDRRDRMPDRRPGERDRRRRDRTGNGVRCTAGQGAPEARNRLRLLGTPISFSKKARTARPRHSSKSGERLTREAHAKHPARGARADCPPPPNPPDGCPMARAGCRSLAARRRRSGRRRCGAGSRACRTLPPRNAPWAALRDLVGQGTSPLRVVIAAGRVRS